MTDFPRHIPVPTHISSMTRWMNGFTAHNTASVGAGVATLTWVANTAVFIPMDLPWAYRVARAFWVRGSAASGNVDLGIYSPTGTRLWSSGSTAIVSASSQPQYISLSPDLLLQPGRYLMAMATDGTTNMAFGNATQQTARLSGLTQMSSAFPLPAAAVFETWAINANPFVGITNTSSGF